MNMIVSGVSEKDGKKIAYVCFEDGKRTADGIIPECRIVNNTGFTDNEVTQLEDYLRQNLTAIKKEAAKINPLSAFMK